MTRKEDVVIVGGGAASVAAARALVRRGIRPAIYEAGDRLESAPFPEGPYLKARQRDRNQFDWQLGGGEGLRRIGNYSPKLRVPRYQAIFDNYAAQHLNLPRDFQPIGAQVVGGMSTAWGANVSAFSPTELGDIDYEDMKSSYSKVAQLIGLSGAAEDALKVGLGVDDWAAPALPMDDLSSQLWSRRDDLGRFRLGRARVAVLHDDRHARLACNESGNCLWGCERKSIWSAAYDIDALELEGAITLYRRMQLQRIQPHSNNGLTLHFSTSSGTIEQVATRKLLLAAGTLNSTRLVLSTLGAGYPITLNSNPMAAFALLLPRTLGRVHKPTFGLAQLSFLQETIHGDAFGCLYSTANLPVSDFLEQFPLPRCFGLAPMRNLLPSLLVGNVFLPGDFSEHRVKLDASGQLRIEGHESVDAFDAMRYCQASIGKAFAQAGAYMVPGSFTKGAMGADLHYACSLPIKADPTAPHHCRLNGEVSGIQNVHVIDGASLPMLPAKAHTLTIMANADRIAQSIF